MKKILQISLTALVLLSASWANAWTYSDGNALLILRQSGANDLEFNLGNVSQFLNQANGFSTTVTGWDVNLAKSTFGADLSGVSFIVIATSSDAAANPSAWVSSGDPVAVPHNLSFPTWRGNLYSVINSIGTRPLTYLVPTAGNSAYSIDPGGTYRLASYDYIVSNGGVNSGAIPQLGGNVAFRVEQTIPGTVGFWQIEPSTVSPRPASKFIGTFKLESTGKLTFTAGTPASNILTIGRSGDVSSVSFTTSPGGNYSLGFTTILGGTVSGWSTVSGPVVGGGSTQTLNHTNSDTSGFYGVIRTD
ncbi:MAG: hypothetical protein JWM04_615 [Verrucomicrobiales bacterium]|jgi:hypothetical protein|nr:hypothetical protein [Verrucomicrobiales bacterium]